MMKWFFKTAIVLSLVVFCNKAFAQIDTMNYLKQFEANKSQYINKPLSFLLEKMTQIQPKTIWFIPVTNKRSIIRESALKFCDMDYSFSNAITLHITWKEEIPYTEVEYYQKKNGFYFTNDERAFYGNKIIKDILVYR